MEWWFNGHGDPAEDLAREEVLLEAARASGAPRGFAYRWARPALVLGYGQDGSSVDLAACRAAGVPVLRRATGGTGVLYDRDVALSLALPPGHPWAATIGGLYDAFVGSIRSGLASLGVETVQGECGARPGPRSPICFEDQLAETLLLNGKKILGCAQARRREGVLIHGALLLGVDPALQARVYGVAPARIEGLLGHLPQDAYPSPEALARSLAGRIASDLGEAEVLTLPAPPLPESLALRLGDPKWVLA